MYTFVYVLIIIGDGDIKILTESPLTLSTENTTVIIEIMIVDDNITEPEESFEIMLDYVTDQGLGSRVSLQPNSTIITIQGES